MDNTYAFIQVRLSSSRLPAKALMNIGKFKSIELTIKRLKLSKKIKKIFLLTTQRDYNLINISKKNNIEFFVGDEKNVLKRFYDCSSKYKIKMNDNILRITGDCPFIDPKFIDIGINIIEKSKYDVVTNVKPLTFPDGLDFVIFKNFLLKESYKKCISDYDLEHVTPYILRNKKNKIFNIKLRKDFSNYRFTLDEKIDLEFLNMVFSKIKKINFSFKELIECSKKIKKIKKFKPFFDAKKKYNIGSKISNGYKLWLKAQNLISGGNMLISKRPDFYLPYIWPTYYKKSKDCYIWDVDGKKYVDLCMMGIGTSLLGYANSKVDNKVKDKIKFGIVSTLNSKEDIKLAEMLIKLNPWADMVKFARSGGEALAVSIRLARAFSKKNKVAFCGYHGWHDWYLSANLKNKSILNKHLLTDLKIEGVPKFLKNSTFSFDFNNIHSFKKILSKNNDIGAVIMEVERFEKPKKKFLEFIRNYTMKKNIPLIFDECSTGFRLTDSGMYKKYGINPDLVMYGKSISNGYAFSALVGKKELMLKSENSFISSTTWSEGVGPTAAIATLEEMQRIKSWKIIDRIGSNIKRNWNDLFKKNRINFKITGTNAILKFEILSKYFSYYRTFITQEMLKRGYLATNIIYVSTKHNKKILNKYYSILDELLKKISQCERGLIKAADLLDLPIIQKKINRR